VVRLNVMRTNKKPVQPGKDARAVSPRDQPAALFIFGQP